ncbi:hypothetical protein CRE_28277 [Caenorhabditis remanei]|uniref:Uncharacterized protein n=1 Tax=Caenorhabditis remanei TaxID=31234 RepID=E3LN35_CAERE|nr:hypothetical protein CRE_28277 [Caenorhabditis remanei]
MTMVKTLVALATERMLLKTSGPTFLRGIEFMYAAGLAPDRLSVMMTSSHKYVLQFHSKCDIRPFAANYPNFGRVLRGIVHVREWRIKSIEFVNVAFYMRDVDNLERAIEKLGVELVLLRNCTYPGVQRGDEAVKFLSALNRKKQAVVCEYGDDRLKHRIGRRASGHRTRRASRNGQEVVAPPGDGAEAIIAPGAAQPAAIVQVGALEENVPAVIAPHGARVHGAAPHGIRRPIPPNPEQVRQMQQNPQMIPPRLAVPVERNADVPPAGIAPAPRVVEPQIRILGQPAGNSNGRVVVGAHVYEFRAIDAPNGDATPRYHNVNHLINVLNDNSANDVRVIVLPSRGGVPGAAININNNDNYVFRQITHQEAVGAPRPGDPIQHHFVAPIRGDRAIHMGQLGNAQQQQQQQAQYDQQPAQLMVAPQAPRPHRFVPQQVWDAYPINRADAGQIPQVQAAAPEPVPMFGDAVNEPQVQRNGDESNDSTDREEMDDAEHQRNEALRDLVAGKNMFSVTRLLINLKDLDPEAQPNFAPVDAQAVDLDMLEEEGEAEDDEVMEGVVMDGQFMMDDQAVMQ